MEDLDNPYRAPATIEVAPVHAELSDAAQIRRLHLKHEASVKSVGLLYFVVGLLLLFGGFSISGFVMTNDGFGNAGGVDEQILWATVFWALAIFQLCVGWGLRRLRPWVKIPATLVAALGLLSFPIGTLFNAYVLYLIHSSKGQVVLSARYQEVLVQTPEIKYRTSLLMKVLAGILVSILLLGIGLALVGM